MPGTLPCASFRGLLHRSWKWAAEVPLPVPGDRRAWDAMISLATCRYGVEVETSPRDGQALGRRLQLKLRDGGVDGLVLVLPRNRQVHEFLDEAQPTLGTLFTVEPRRDTELLAAGVDPGGNAIVLVSRQWPLRAGP